MVSLAPVLYAAHRSALSDPTSVPAWGNAPTEEREAWERVAERAEKEVLAPLRAKIAAIGSDSAARPLVIESLPTEEQTAERIATWLLGGVLANAAGVNLTDPRCPIGVALTIAALGIRRFAWKDDAHLVFATEPAASTPDLHGDIIIEAGPDSDGLCIVREPTLVGEVHYTNSALFEAVRAGREAQLDELTRLSEEAGGYEGERTEATRDRIARVLNDRSGFGVDGLDEETRADLLDAITKAVRG